MSTKPAPLLFTQLKACRSVVSLKCLHSPPPRSWISSSKQQAGGLTGRIRLLWFVTSWTLYAVTLISVSVLPASRRGLDYCSCVVGFIIQMGDFSHSEFPFQNVF